MLTRHTARGMAHWTVMPQEPLPLTESRICVNDEHSRADRLTPGVALFLHK